MPESVPSNEKRLKQQPPSQRQKVIPPPQIPKSAAEAAAAVKAAVARTSAAKKQPQQPMAKAVSLSLRSTPQVEQQQQQQQQQRRQRALGPSSFATPAVTCSSANTTIKGKSSAATKGGSVLSFGASTALWLNTDSRRRRLGKKRRRIEVGAEASQIAGTNAVPTGSTASAAAAAATAADTGRLGSTSLCSAAPRRRLSAATYPPPNSLCRLDPQRCSTLAGNNCAAPEVGNANNAPSGRASKTTAPAVANSSAGVTPEKGAITPTLTPAKQPAKAAAAAAGAAADAGLQPTSEESNDENGAPSVAVDLYDQNPIKKLCRRLRSNLNQRFRSSNLETIENNMHLIRLRKHPTQQYIESEKLIENGVSQDQQIINKLRIGGYLETIKARKPQKKKKNAEDEEGANNIDLTKYPEWITFRLRIRREDSDQLWNAFVMRRKVMSTQMERGPAAVKPADKYNEKYIDVWTRSLTVQARPIGLLRDIVRPVFSRLGLENRADFQVNVGSFPGDKRPGSKIKIEGQLSPLTSVTSLYERGLTELFITPWPGLLDILPPGYMTRTSLEKQAGGKASDKKNPPEEGKTSKKGKKGKKAARNQSNERLVRSYVRASQLAATMRSLSKSSVLLAKVGNSNAT